MAYRQKRGTSTEVSHETKSITGIMKKTALYYALLGLDDKALAIGKATLQLHKKELSVQRVEVTNIVKLEQRIRKLQSTSTELNIEDMKVDLRERRGKISKAVQMRFPQCFSQEPINEENWRKRNQFVSGNCAICKQSTEFSSAVKQTSPRQNFGNRRLKIHLVYTGDGKELNNCVGVVGSACYRCHVKNLWGWNTSRGKSHSMIRSPWETDDYE